MTMTWSKRSMAKPGAPSASPCKSRYAVRSVRWASGARRRTASAIGRGLEIEQLRVPPAERQQLFVGARLDQAPLLENEDAVRLAHRRKPMRDEDRDAPVAQLAQPSKQLTSR